MRIRALYIPLFFLALVASVFFLVLSQREVDAKNILTYKDTLSSSAPDAYSNHTLSFTLNTDIAAGGSFTVTPPSGFAILATSTFDIRNVEMLVNGTPRSATGTLSSTTDQVVITTGSPGEILYNLNLTDGLDDGDDIVIKIGNHTTDAVQYAPGSSSTATTTGDIGIVNSADTGVHRVELRTTGAAETAYADFVIFLIDQVTIVNIDTTETVPPIRFNGAPSGEIGGTTLSVEVSVETDELAVCKYDTVAGTSFSSMPNEFTNTGQLVHTFITAVVNETTYTFYVRCIDDEGNFNTDDYLITFDVPEVPEGESGGDGNNDGEGTGDGDSGTGDGDGSSGDGSSGSGGSSSGSGGSGGGGGGGAGGEEGSDEAGGPGNGPYESGDATVILSGYAFPRARIYGLVDGYQAVTGTADTSGRFSLTIDAIARGVYTFGVYAIDASSVKSSTYSTTFSVQGARTSSLSNVNIMPSIKVSPDPVTPGQEITFTGYAIPNSVVTLENQKDKSSVTLKSYTTNSDSNGRFTYALSSDGFSNGTYKVRAKSVQEVTNISTNFSSYTFYGVGEVVATITADLNRDGRVNLTDFSILLFWWATDGGNSSPPADINRDGLVSLTDFSILLFNWTG